MSISRILMGADSFAVGEEKAIALVSTGNKICTPLLVTKKTIADHFFGKTITAFPYFPLDYGEGYYTNRSINLMARSVLPVNSKRLLEDHPVKEIDAFDHNRILEISRFIKETGVITFIIKDYDAAIKFMNELNLFSNTFRYTTYIYNNLQGATSPKVEKDHLTLYFSIFDLRYAIPIFNKKKASGFAGIIGLFWPESTKNLGHKFSFGEIFFMCNKFAENIQIVDGKLINTQRAVDTALIHHFVKQLTIQKRSENKEPIIEPEKKEVVFEKHELDSPYIELNGHDNNIDMYYTTTNYTFTSSSTT